MCDDTDLNSQASNSADKKGSAAKRAQATSGGSSGGLNGGLNCLASLGSLLAQRELKPHGATDATGPGSTAGSTAGSAGAASGGNGSAVDGDGAILDVLAFGERCRDQMSTATCISRVRTHSAEAARNAVTH